MIAVAAYAGSILRIGNDCYVMVMAFLFMTMRALPAHQFIIRLPP